MKKVMKALSVRQPFAFLIAKGLKTIELRSRRTNYRGPLLICVSSHKTAQPDRIRLKRGVALCVVDLIDCRPMTKADCKRAWTRNYRPQFWSWVLSGAREIEQFPVSGKLGIFEVELPAAS